jgi:hypothetical protein
LSHSSSTLKDSEDKIPNIERQHQKIIESLKEVESELESDEKPELKEAHS